MQHGIGLWHRFGEHEEHQHVQHNANHHAERTEQPVGHHTGQHCLHRLQCIDGEQERVDPLRWLARQPHQDVGTFVPG